MEKTLIDLRGITKSFDGELILDDLNLSIRENSFVTLLGPSGCGKTTTLRIIGGFVHPDKGQVFFEGKDITNLPANKRQLNTVFQKYALFPHMTIAENIAFGLRIRNKSEAYIRDKIQYALKLVNLQGYEKRSVTSLSGGQQQRIAIARAIVNEPRVLLLDEPLGALDLKLRQEMQYELIRLKNELGITFIYVTHDQTEAMTLADRIVIMSATKNPAGTGTIGRVEQIGTPQEVYNNPVNKFVAGFIGSPAMNFIPVKLEGNEIVAEGLRLTVPEGALKVLREKNYEGKELIFGIRPEDINAEAAFLETFPNSVVHAKISVSELLGAESHLYCQVGSSEFVARVDSRDYLETGAGIDLGFDLNKAHFFDPETEKTVY